MQLLLLLQSLTAVISLQLKKLTMLIIIILKDYVRKGKEKTLQGFYVQFKS